MKENSTEGNIEILIKKLNKELDFLIENANKTEQLTATSIIAMKEPIILLFLSVLSNHKRILKVNEELKNNTRKNEQNSLEFDFDGDWAELKRILNESRKTNEYITYKGEKWINEKYCILTQKLKEIIKELNIDIERNKRRKIQNNEGGSLQMKMIAYAPEIIKIRLLKLLESEE